jgi:two-component system nitrogen regulation response regulator GlnG
VGSGYEFADYIANAEVRHRRPDVIISDVRMPGFDGLSLLASIRGASWRTPVILMTAFGADDVVIGAMKHRAVTVLDKPFDIRELKQLVDAVIGVPFDLHERPPDEELL